MSSRWLQWFRPKRRWFQYRLRTLFVLITLLCVWLSYNAWRYQQEKAIVAGIMSFDPKAQIDWSGPWWLRWLDDDYVPRIFRRVQEINLYADDDVVKEVADLRLQRLSALKELTLELDVFVNAYDGNQARSQADALNQMLPGVKIVPIGLFGGEPIDEYLWNPTDTAAEGAREWFDDYRQSRDKYYATPLELEPYCRSLSGDSSEEISKLLVYPHKDLRIAAAQDLWSRHSCRFCRAVIDFATKLAADSDAARKLKSLIETDLTAERILSELHKPIDDNTEWWAWLAAMRPHPTLVPALVQLTQDRQCPLEEVAYALRQSKDARALPTLLMILTKSENPTAYSIAADAIDKIGDAAVEMQLLEVLVQCKDQQREAMICRVLEKTGTARSLPKLRNHVADRSGMNVFDVVGAARRAIKAIERRSRQPSPERGRPAR